MKAPLHGFPVKGEVVSSPSLFLSALTSNTLLFSAHTHYWGEEKAPDSYQHAHTHTHTDLMFQISACSSGMFCRLNDSRLTDKVFATVRIDVT